MEKNGTRYKEGTKKENMGGEGKKGGGRRKKAFEKK